MSDVEEGQILKWRMRAFALGKIRETRLWMLEHSVAEWMKTDYPEQGYRVWP